MFKENENLTSIQNSNLTRYFNFKTKNTVSWSYCWEIFRISELTTTAEQAKVELQKALEQLAAKISELEIAQEELKKLSEEYEEAVSSRRAVERKLEECEQRLAGQR